MDMQTVFIGIAAFVAITLILLITTFCMREKTYEEVLEEQRKQQEELFGKPVQAKDKKKKKAFKKGKEKEKVVVDKTEDKSSQVTDHFDQKMVEIEPDPEIIEPTAEPVHTTPRKRKAGKSILTNKTEKSLVSKTSVVTTTTSFHPGHPPMDDVELKHERERRASVSEQHLREMAPIAPPVEAMADKKDKKKKEREAKKQLEAAEVIVQEEIRITHAVETQAAPAPPPPKPEGKKERKRRSPDSGDGVSDSSKMVEAIRMAPLSDVDIQLLIDVLLTKQTGTITKTDEWTQKPQKGDPTFALKKQLEEKERALQEEQTQAHAANTKVKEQKEQILQEKQKLVILQKQAEEKINRQGAEIKALQDRMAHTAEQHRMELHRQMEQARPGPDPQQAEMVRQLQEENQRLQAEMAHLRNSTLDMGNMQSQLKIMQDEMAKNARQLAQTDGAKKSFENKCRQQEETIRQLEAGKEFGLAWSDQKLKSLKDAENVLSRKLKETEEQLRRAESRNSGLARDLDKSKSVGHQAEKEAANLRDHIAHVDSSQSQSADQVRHLEAKLQEIEGARQQMEGRIGDMEKTNVEKDRDIQTLRQENHSLLGQLQTVKERTAGEGQEAPPRGDGDSKKVIVSETVNTATIDIAIHEKILGEKDSEVCKLQDELKAKLADLSRVNEDLDAQRKKNNELREKSQSAVESHSENISCAIQKEKDQYSTALQKIFPSLNIKDTMVRDDWSGVLEKDVTTYIQSVSSTAPPDSSEVDKLQSQVQHYKSVLAQTEGILNQLQSSVESEEQKWHQKVNASEEELQGAREEVKRLKGSSEMKDQLSMLEERLSESESEREKLKTQLSQVSQEIDCLKNEVQESQQAQKKLQTTNVKLNGMLKTGYDSLKVEQENVRVLQKELANKSKSISNGTSPSKEIEELKGKLMTTQRQLDKEIQCNKALSQRLLTSIPVDEPSGRSHRRPRKF